MRLETVEAAERAVALAPDNSQFYARLAWLVSNDDPRKSKEGLERAVALNPRDAGSWIELGLRAESEGDEGSAQERLLRAAEVDATFLPRWTLANYYFRHFDEARFWLWMKKAAAMAYGDPEALFRLCGRVKEDGNLIDRLELRNGDLRAGYVAYLLSRNRADLLGPSVHRVLDDKREADVPLLLTVCERLLDSQRGEEALEIWNKVANPAAEGVRGIVNSAFASAPTSRGLDWRLPSVEGISVARETDSGGLRLTFSGREPETADLLVQLIPLKEKALYELTFVYRTQGIARRAGLLWQVTDRGSGVILAKSEILASEADAEGQLQFPAPASGVAQLALRYRRTQGTTRLEGFLTLRKVGLRPVAQVPVKGDLARK